MNFHHRLMRCEIELKNLLLGASIIPKSSKGLHSNADKKALKKYPPAKNGPQNNLSACYFHGNFLLILFLDR